MKISGVESNKASVSQVQPYERILPENRPKRSSNANQATVKRLSPLEQGMAVAENALKDVPETRDEIVLELKERISKGEYDISGQDIAEMMLRRRAADKIR